MLLVAATGERQVVTRSDGFKASGRSSTCALREGRRASAHYRSAWILLAVAPIVTCGDLPRRDYDVETFCSRWQW
jgi:hypothetical protein